MHIWPQLSAVLHPADHPSPSSWCRCYETKFALATLLQPKTIFEIGVRAGYSAFAFLHAIPAASYLGIDANGDTHGGFHGAILHARQLIAPFQAEVREMTSAEFASRHDLHPSQGYDLIHIDGDHSFSGCLFDLRLARELGFRHLLVDDTSGIKDVREACDQFAAEQTEGLTQIEIHDGHHGTILFHRINNFTGEPGGVSPGVPPP